MHDETAMKSTDWRQSERRRFRNLARFPLHGRGGEWILTERRQRPCRRLDSVAAREVAYLNCIAAVIRSQI